MSHSGVLYKRNVPISPPSMSKVFSVLWGTLLLDYDTEEESKKSSASPKVASEILGISEWDGQGRANQYPNGFLLVTHTGGTYYLSAPSAAEREEWILHVKRALECHFANSSIIPFKPSKIIHSRPPPQQNAVCPRTSAALPPATGTLCRCCGRGFSSAEHVAISAPLLQVGSEVCEKVCVDCSNMQIVIIWLKSLNYTHAMTLHDLTPEVNKDIGRFKASFKLQRQPAGSRLDMAAVLLEQKSINADEFEELRRVDQDYRRETMMEEAERLKLALDAIGQDMQTIISLLLNPAATDRGHRMSYFQVVVKILEIADREPALIDFYFPQLLQAHLIEAANHTPNSLMKVDLLQQALLVLSQKYPQLGLKLAWALMAIGADYLEKRVTQVQYAACCCLLLQLELIVTGLVSPIADIPQCHLLAQLLRAARHQQDEIASELGTLFLVRRRLQEVYCAEEEQRKNRHIFHFARRDGAFSDSPSEEASSPKSSAFRLDGPSCLLLLNHLGVGPAASVSRDSEDSSEGRHEGEGEGDTEGEGDGEEWRTRRRRRKQLGVFRGMPHWSGFSMQLDFMDRINSVVDGLRFIDRAQRSEKLVEDLKALNSDGGAGGENSNSSNSSSSFLGWDPTGAAGEPKYRITRILTDDCKVFRTKARAPSLIVCEVMRDDSDSAADASSEGAHETSPSQIHSPDPHLKSASRDPRQRTRTCSAEVEKMLAEGSPIKVDRDRSTDLELSKVGELVDSSISSISQAIADIHLAASHEFKEESGADTISPFSKGDGQGSGPGSEAVKHLDFERAAETPSPASAASPNFGYQSVPRRLSGSLLSSNRKSGSSNFHTILNSASTGDLRLTMGKDGLSVIEPLTSPKGIMSAKKGDGVQAVLFADPSPAAETVLAEAVDIDDDAAGTEEKIVQSAQRLLKEGKIDEKEFQLLISSDNKYRDEAAKEEAVVTMQKVESAFGESWVAKKERVLGGRFDAMAHLHDEDGDSSSFRTWPKWDLRCFIVKSNDDLRQEVCCIQLMSLFQEILRDFGLGNQLWLRPYSIVSTGSTTGVVQVLTDTLSLDALKKIPGFVSLPVYFTQTYGSSPDRLLAAKRNFAASLAAYSLFCYILLVKDRHNGNMLLDTDGHIIHIDFGFLLSIAPGGAFSLETAPFKLTEEMVEVLDGLESPLFGEFVKAFTTGFLALRANAENIVETVQVLSINSPFPCFAGKDSNGIIEKLRGRFRADLGFKEFVQHCLDLIITSYGHYGTRQYDSFQYFSNGISS